MLKYGRNFRVGTLEIVELLRLWLEHHRECPHSWWRQGRHSAFQSGSRLHGRATCEPIRIWLVQQMRSTFVGTISRNDGDIDALFKYLEALSATPDA